MRNKYQPTGIDMVIWALMLIIILVSLICAMRCNGDVYAEAEAGYLFETGDVVTNIQVGYERVYPNRFGFDVYTSIDTMMQFKGADGVAFAPYNVAFVAGGIVQYRGAFLQLEHYCIHPVFSFPDQFEAYFYGENATIISVGYSTRRR